MQIQVQYEVANVQTTLKLTTPYKCPCSPEVRYTEPFCPFLQTDRFHLVALLQITVRRAEAWKLLASQSSCTRGIGVHVVAF